MNKPSADIQKPSVPDSGPARSAVPFGVNGMQLNGRYWLIVLGIVTVSLVGTPRLWKSIERFQTGSDFRIPYALSKDYWLYQRRLEMIARQDQIVVLGDSVVWGEYVLPEGTLSHFLNQETGHSDRFINGGVNGLFPLAMEGLVGSYGGSLHDGKIIVHCNVLWMSSPRADLSAPQEEAFNHSRLVPQFTPQIPSYRADASERISTIIERNVGFSGWVAHLQNAYFDQRSIPSWTLEDDGGSPPQLPNAYRNPLAQIRFEVPVEPPVDPLRGPGSPRHKPWNDGGAEPVHFDWVALEDSLQWHAFQRTVELLRSRGNEVLVVLGPFNEHMIAEDQRPIYRRLRDGIAAWHAQHRIPCIMPDTLPSEFYADASHPLTDGYALLAGRIAQQEAFRIWLNNDFAGQR